MRVSRPLLSYAVLSYPIYVDRRQAKRHSCHVACWRWHCLASQVQHCHLPHTSHSLLPHSARSIITNMFDDFMLLVGGRAAYAGAWLGAVELFASAG